MTDLEIESLQFAWEQWLIDALCRPKQPSSSGSAHSFAWSRRFHAKVYELIQSKMASRLKYTYYRLMQAHSPSKQYVPFRQFCPLMFASISGQMALAIVHLATVLIPICLHCLNCTKFGQLILNLTNIVATRCHILRLKCTKFDFGWGSASDPDGREEEGER